MPENKEQKDSSDFSVKPCDMPDSEYRNSPKPELEYIRFHDGSIWKPLPFHTWSDGIPSLDGIIEPSKVKPDKTIELVKDKNGDLIKKEAPNFYSDKYVLPTLSTLFSGDVLPDTILDANADETEGE